MLAASWRKQNNLQVFDFGTGKLIQEIPSDYNKSMVKKYFAIPCYAKRSSIMYSARHSVKCPTLVKYLVKNLCLATLVIGEVLG